MALLTNGFSTTATFGSMSTSATGDFEVVDLKPFGIDGGSKIDVTTMSSSGRKRFVPQSLYEITPMELTLACETTFLTAVLANVNVSQTITINFPDGTNWPCTGYIQKFDPDTFTNGARPTFKVTVEFTGASAPSYTP